MVISDIIYSVTKLIRAGDNTGLKDFLKSLSTEDIVELINEVPDASRPVILLAVPASLAERIFKVLEVRLQKDLFDHATPDQAARLLALISPDDRIAFLENLSGEAVKEFLQLLPAAERAKTLALLGYPEHSVGRLMTPNYIAVKKESTVKQVLDYIRESGRNSETVNFIYVVDDHGVLIDDIRIKEFLFSSPEKKVTDLMDGKYIFLSVTDDEETAVKIFRQTSRFAMPVLDKNNILLGCVTIDDVLRLAEDEGTEDMQKIGAVEVLEEPYMDTPFFTLMRKRSGWLIVLFLGESLTATAMGFFEHDIEKAAVLALFIPLIISSGGNSGSQASSLIIRALALGEITFKDWFRVMRREILSGLFLGTVLGIVGFIRIVAVVPVFPNLYTAHWLLVAVTVFFSLIGVVMWGTLAGSMLPIVLKKVGQDPAVSSAPFVATLVDVTGLVIYFSVALLIMHGTLL